MSTGNATEVAAIKTEIDKLWHIMTEAKGRLDADIPQDQPVHPVSAYLTGMAITIGRMRALLARLEQPSE